jgi:hypothetical protein
MDKSTIQRMLADAQRELEHLEKQVAGLQKIRDGYTELLMLHPPAVSKPPETAKPATQPGANRQFDNKAKGEISMRKAVMAFVERNPRREFTDQEALDAALAMGAITESEKPVNTVGLHLHHIKQKTPGLRKLSPHGWRYDPV